MDNALNWFEIPSTDIDRAAAFYGAIFDRDNRGVRDASWFQDGDASLRGLAKGLAAR